MTDSGLSSFERFLNFCVFSRFLSYVPPGSRGRQSTIHQNNNDEYVGIQIGGSLSSGCHFERRRTSCVLPHRVPLLNGAPFSCLIGRVDEEENRQKIINRESLSQSAGGPTRLPVV